jgi:hypothetical protein
VLNRRALPLVIPLIAGCLDILQRDAFGVDTARVILTELRWSVYLFRCCSLSVLPVLDQVRPEVLRHCVVVLGSYTLQLLLLWVAPFFIQVVSGFFL